MRNLAVVAYRRINREISVSCLVELAGYPRASGSIPVAQPSEMIDPQPRSQFADQLCARIVRVEVSTAGEKRRLDIDTSSRVTSRSVTDEQDQLAAGWPSRNP